MYVNQLLISQFLIYLLFQIQQEKMLVSNIDLHKLYFRQSKLRIITFNSAKSRMQGFCGKP